MQILQKTGSETAKSKFGVSAIERVPFSFCESIRQLKVRSTFQHMKSIELRSRDHSQTI